MEVDKWVVQQERRSSSLRNQLDQREPRANVELVLGCTTQFPDIHPICLFSGKSRDRQVTLIYPDLAISPVSYGGYVPAELLFQDIGCFGKCLLYLYPKFGVSNDVDWQPSRLGFTS